MAEQVLKKMRIQLRRATTAEWEAYKDVVPTAGEPCFDLELNTLKIGDGTHKYSELDFVYAKAADVVAACKSESALTTFVNNVISNAGIATNEALTTLAGRVTTAEGEIDVLLNQKLDSPTNAGTTGQVPVYQADGSTVWGDMPVQIQADWNVTDTTSDAYIANKPTIPSKTSDLTNDSGFLTSVPDEYITETELTAKGYLTSYTETDPTVPAWAKAETKPTYTAAEVGALPADTVIPSIDGLASETYVDNAVARVNAVPSATTDDNDKILMVVNGVPTWKEADSLSITSSDDGAGNVTITIA